MSTLYSLQQNRLNSSQNAQPRVGVSACLLGRKVRFDGGHKNNQLIVSSLSKHLELKPVCPEVEAGFSTPRAAMQLRKNGEQIRLVINKAPFQDVTGQMNDYIHAKLDSLAGLDGFIFKKDSPSCGAFRVPVVINQDGYRNRDAVGLFAGAFRERFPLIPIEEEGRLNDSALRENFFERVYAYQRWKMIPDAMHNVKGLIEFHARHKLMLMGRGSHYYQELGRLVADTTRSNLAHRRSAYIDRFMQVMTLLSRPGRQVNVMQHIMGYLKPFISAEDKQELLAVFEAYRQQELPLITPITLLSHHLRVHPQPYINQQHYLDPFPRQLALRSLL
ncbi:MAG: DUF523 and DUF1722 domain-containing protein [Gammaproteobacteria bacterium]|nr:DUF523 and DUF1722 domain-containing protein [Gammaproteobacteria bacterium]MBL6999288.1 DUF523 and DUF1722 domain-containing protein [Gammaproteobacteria bacterium]